MKEYFNMKCNDTSYSLKLSVSSLEPVLHNECTKMKKTAKKLKVENK